MDKDIKTKSDQVYEGQQDNVVYTCGGLIFFGVIRFLLEKILFL